MAYGATIDSTNPDHRWAFDSDYTDSIGAETLVSSGFALGVTLLCEDATGSAASNSVADRLTSGAVADLNGALDRTALAGWIQFNSIQQPMVSIFKEGGSANSFGAYIGFGNSLMFEVNDGGNIVQLISDSAIVPHRPYHITLKYSGSGFSNEITAFIDGVQLTDVTPIGGAASNASLANRALTTIGLPSGASSIGGTTLILAAPATCYYSQWASWSGANSESLSVSDIREKLFEAGARPETVISSDTASNMQIALDGLSGSIRNDSPLAIRIMDVTGSGDLSLDVDNIQFDPLGSIDIQWMGTGTLTLTNINNSNTTKVSALNGVINLVNPRLFTLDNILVGSEVRIYADDAGAGNNYGTELAGVESIASPVFTYNHPGTTDPVVIQVMKIGQEEFFQRVTLDNSNQSLTVQQTQDKNI